MQNRSKKSSDLSLFIWGVVVALILYVIPKNSFTVSICLLLIFGLIVFSIKNHSWIENKKWSRISTYFILLLIVGVLGFFSWPHEEKSGVPAKLPPPAATEPIKPETFKTEPILKGGDFESGDLKNYWKSSESIITAGYVSPDAATAGTVTVADGHSEPKEIFSLDYRFGRSGKCLWINNPNRTSQGKPHHLYQENIKVMPKTTYKVVFYIQGEIKYPDSFWFSLNDLWINEKRIFDKPARFDEWTPQQVFLTTGDQYEAKFWIIVNDEATNLRIDDIALIPLPKEDHL